MSLLKTNSNLYLTYLRFRRNKLAVLGLVIMAALIFVAIFAPFIAPFH